MPLLSIRLRRHPRLVTAASRNAPMGNGETGEAVETLQQALIDLGFPMPLSTRKTGFPDGICGKETCSVVRAFQAREPLFKDGTARPSNPTAAESNPAGYRDEGQSPIAGGRHTPSTVM
jgi:peptidoglycan hydrolase-like protein with peptidoglycan-binding domain